MSIPTTRERIPAHSSEDWQERIEREIRRGIRNLSTDPQAMERRIEEPRAEWDIERAIEAKASVIAFIGVKFCECLLASLYQRRYGILIHVNETFPRDKWVYWDIAFLIWGALMFFGGWHLLKSGKNDERQLVTAN